MSTHFALLHGERSRWAGHLGCAPSPTRIPERTASDGRSTVKPNPAASSQDTKGNWFFRFDIPVSNDWGSSRAMTALMKTTDKYGRDRQGVRAVQLPAGLLTMADADEQGRRLPAQARAVRRHGRRRLHRQLGGRARAPGPLAAVVGDRCPRLRPGRRAGHPGRLAGARRVRRAAVGLAGGPAQPRARRPHGRRRQRPRRRARRLQEPVGLPARAADLAVRRRAVPGLQLHADVGRDDRAPRVRDRDLRLDAAHAAGRPGGRHRPQRPQPGPVARVRRHAARPGSSGRTSSRTCSRRATARSSRASTGRSRAGSACRRTSSAATRSTSTATTRATPTRGSRRPTTSSTRSGSPHSGYEGDWWPASVVDDFATAFGGGTHIPRCGRTRRAACRRRSRTRTSSRSRTAAARPSRRARARARRRPRPRSSSPATARRPPRPSTRRSTATRSSAARS